MALSSRLNVLVVEDEFNLSALLTEALSGKGHLVLPAYSVTDAFGTLHSGEHIDAAILDVELGDGVVFPFADYLKERGIPYLFASGVYPYAVPQAHQDVPFVGKPYQLEHLLEQLDQVWAADVARRG